eukprot:gene4298-6094_t
MLLESVDDEHKIMKWLTNQLQSIKQSDAAVLAEYILTLLKQDKPTQDLKKDCIEQLKAFLKDNTNLFVNSLFTTLHDGNYKSIGVAKDDEDVNESIDYSERRGGRGYRRRDDVSGYPSDEDIRDTRNRNRTEFEDNNSDSDSNNQRRRRDRHIIDRTDSNDQLLSIEPQKSQNYNIESTTTNPPETVKLSRNNNENKNIESSKDRKSDNKSKSKDNNQRNVDSQVDKKRKSSKDFSNNLAEHDHERDENRNHHRDSKSQDLRELNANNNRQFVNNQNNKMKGKNADGAAIRHDNNAKKMFRSSSILTEQNDVYRHGTNNNNNEGYAHPSSGFMNQSNVNYNIQPDPYFHQLQLQQQFNKQSNQALYQFPSQNQQSLGGPDGFSHNIPIAMPMSMSGMIAIPLGPTMVDQQQYPSLINHFQSDSSGVNISQGNLLSHQDKAPLPPMKQNNHTLSSTTSNIAPPSEPVTRQTISVSYEDEFMQQHTNNHIQQLPLQSTLRPPIPQGPIITNNMNEEYRPAPPSSQIPANRGNQTNDNTNILYNNIDPYQHNPNNNYFNNTRNFPGMNSNNYPMPYPVDGTNYNANYNSQKSNNRNNRNNNNLNHQSNQNFLPENERRTLKCTGIPMTTKTEELKAHFASFGYVVEIQLSSVGAIVDEELGDNKKVFAECLVQFYSAEMAKKCKNSPIPVLNNRFIKVYFSHFNIIPPGDVMEMSPDMLEKKRLEQIKESTGGQNYKQNKHHNNAHSFDNIDKNSYKNQPVVRVHAGTSNKYRRLSGDGKTAVGEETLDTAESTNKSTTGALPPAPGAPLSKEDLEMKKKFEELRILRQQAEIILKKKESLIQGQIDQYRTMMDKLESEENNPNNNAKNEKILSNIETKIIDLQSQLRIVREQMEKANSSNQAIPSLSTVSYSNPVIHNHSGALRGGGGRGGRTGRGGRDGSGRNQKLSNKYVLGMSESKKSDDINQNQDVQNNDNNDTNHNDNEMIINSHENDG